MRAYGHRIVTTMLEDNHGVVEQPSGLFVVLSQDKHFDDSIRLLVHSVGPEVTEDINEGDVLITRGMAGAAVTFEGVEYIIVVQEDALAVDVSA